MWIIKNKFTGEYWSNDWGWGSREGCEKFVDKNYNLPIDGEWEKGE